MSLARNVKMRREELGMYQSELAERTSLSKQYISLIEQGVKKTPSLTTLKKLAKVFNCTLDDLVEDDETERKAV